MSGKRIVVALVVSWNGSRWLPAALNSLRDSSYPVQVVVMDNASTDDSVAIVRSSCPEAHVLAMGSNLGFGQANNHGLRYALSHGADYVLLMNQDAKVERTTVESLVTLSEQHPDFGIISPLQLNYQGTGIDPLMLERVTNNVELLSDAFGCRLASLYELPFISAASWLLPRRVVETVGGFDPLFFHYGEDEDYCQRVRYHGFRIGLAPRVHVYHWHTVTHRNRTFGNEMHECYKCILCDLKRPDRPFSRNALTAFRSSLWALGRSLLRLDAVGSTARACAMLKGLLGICTTHHRYERSKARAQFL